MRRQEWPAWFLIIAGVVLMLHQLGYFEISRANIFSYGFIIIGVLFAVKAFNRKNGQGIFGAVFFLSYGLILTFIRYQVFIRNDEFAVGTLFLSLALANFVLFLFYRDRWLNFTWGVITGLVGGAILSIQMGYYPHWYIYNALEEYWPVALILIGLTIILKAFRERRLTSADQHSIH
jgi:hypothetical protein